MPEIPTECVARVRAGDLAAFEALYRTMHAPLLAFGARYTGDLARAEELLQDLFLDLWRARPGWEVSGSVSAYLYTALRHRALNLRRRDAVEADWAEDEAQDDVRSLHVPPPQVDHRLEADEALTRLADAMQRLPERCALVMQMRWHGGLSYRDIADTLGISVKGVEHQLARGLKALRAEFETD